MRGPILLFLFLALLSTTSYSQFYDSSPSLVMSVEGGKSLSTMSQKHSFGGAASLKLRLPSGDLSDVFITGNLAFFPGKVQADKKKYSAAKAATLLLGYRIYLNPLSDYSSFYLQADAGMSALTTKLISPVFSPSFGYLINDKLDLSIRYNTTFSSDPYKKISYIALGIGYGFNFN